MQFAINNDRTIGILDNTGKCVFILPLDELRKLNVTVQQCGLDLLDSDFDKCNQYDTSKDKTIDKLCGIIERQLKIIENVSRPLMFTDSGIKPIK